MVFQVEGSASRCPPTWQCAEPSAQEAGDATVAQLARVCTVMPLCLGWCNSAEPRRYADPQCDGHTPRHSAIPSPPRARSAAGGGDMSLLPLRIGGPPDRLVDAIER